MNFFSLSTIKDLSASVLVGIGNVLVASHSSVVALYCNSCVSFAVNGKNCASIGLIVEPFAVYTFLRAGVLRGGINEKSVLIIFPLLTCIKELGIGSSNLKFLFCVPSAVSSNVPSNTLSVITCSTSIGVSEIILSVVKSLLKFVPLNLFRPVTSISTNLPASLGNPISPSGKNIPLIPSNLFTESASCCVCIPRKSNPSCISKLVYASPTSTS